MMDKEQREYYEDIVTQEIKKKLDSGGNGDLEFIEKEGRDFVAFESCYSFMAVGKNAAVSDALIIPAAHHLSKKINEFIRGKTTIIDADKFAVSVDIEIVDLDDGFIVDGKEYVLYEIIADVNLNRWWI